MSNKRKSSLTEALTRTARGRDTAEAVIEAPQKAIGAAAGRAKPGRVGKINITGYFDPAVKKSIRLIQAHAPDRTVQDLLAEALNDLFAKHNVPQTAYLSSESHPDSSAE